MKEKIKAFYDSDKRFVVWMFALIILGIVVETGNKIFGWYPDDSGAGYIFSGLCVLLLVWSFIYQTYLVKE